MAKSTIGEAVIKLTFDGSALQTGLQKLGTTAKIGGKVIAAGLAVATTAVVSLGKASIKSYAEYEQLVGGIETLYKDSADDLMAYAKQSYKTAQLSAANYMKTATSFSASLIQGLGGDTKKAADYANRAIISMADNANKMGTDIERIQDAYRGFARQQFNMLDNLALGYGGTRSEMERLISDASKMTKEMDTLGVTVDANSMSFDNIVNAIAVVQEHLGIAGTSAKEASETIQGSFNSMKSAAQDLITGLTNPNADITKLMDNFMETIVGNENEKGFIGNLQPAIENVLKGITILVQKGLPKLIKMLPDILQKSLPDLAKAAVALVVAITQTLPELAPVLADGLTVLMTELIPYLPEIIGGFLEGLGIYLIKGWSKMFETWGSLFSTAFDFLAGIAQQAAEKIWQFFMDVAARIYYGTIKPIADKINELVSILKQAFSAVVNWIQGAVIQPIANFFNGLWNGVKNGATALATGVKNIFEGIMNAVKAPINAIIDGINKVIDSINSLKIPDWVPGVGGQSPNFAHISRLAQGGYARGASNAIIGEAGKEAVIPLERNTDNWAGLLAKTLANEFEQQGLSTDGGITIYMTNEINSELDADEIGRRLLTSIRRAA